MGVTYVFNIFIKISRAMSLIYQSIQSFLIRIYKPACEDARVASPGPACLIRTICKYSMLIGYHINFIIVRFSSTEDAVERAIHCIKFTRVNSIKKLHL